MVCFSAVISLLGKRPVLMGSQTRDFHNMQEAAGMSPNLLVMREAWESEVLNSDRKSSLIDNTALCILVLLYKN
jgi:hypothetical protein